MKKLFTLSFIFTFISVSISVNLFGQGIVQQCSAPTPGTSLVNTNNGTSQSVMMKNGMTITPGHNYTSFTTPFKNTSAEAIAANAGYENHPEFGLLFPGTPCDNCYELVGKRTEMNKTFVKEGVSGKDGGKDIMVQTSSMPMHYRDANGNWETIKTNLVPDINNKGVYAAKEQEAPVYVNVANKFSQLGKAGERVAFDRNLELIYAKPDGSEISLGAADWTNYTAGDEGVFVKNAWPGVDIEMYTIRNGLKTSFVINGAMPAYADGHLLIRDHLDMDKGLSLVSTDGKKHIAGALQIKNAKGEMQYVVSEATAYEKANARNTLQIVEYYLGQNNVVDIALPGSYLNRSASAYPVIIDPLVTLNTSTTVNGSSYNATWAAGMGCLYTNAAMTPVNCTVTDIQFAFQYTATVGQLYGAFSFYIGACRSPGTAAAGQSWSCNTLAAGTCTALVGPAYSIFANMSACLPPPSCPSIALNINMYFYQNWATTAACATTYIYGSQPLVFTVIGHTVELTAAGVTATPATICQGATSSLAVAGVYGVAPYTYSWMPGALTGTPVTVTPAATTTYTVTVTDACGITATGTKTVTVNPISPITGPTVVCVGNTITLSDGPVASVGGGWTSVTPAVATVTATSGIVTGVSAGTTVIKFTSTAGCVATYTITVTPLPGAIGGTTTVCEGSTTPLNNSAAGGVWSSSNTAVATIDPTSGLVYGITPGTTTITYSLGGSCFATTIVTVNPVSVISGTLTVCQFGTTTLSDAIPGGTWSSGTPAVATIGLTSGVVYGVTAGTVTITYFPPAGCPATASVVVNLLDIITGTPAVCVGSSMPLSDAAGAGIWSSNNQTVATVDGTGDVFGVSAGTAIITFLNPIGCYSTATETVNPLAVISVQTIQPTTCGGTGSIILDITPGGSYTDLYYYNGVAASASTASASPLTISGLEGSYTYITVTNVTTSCGSDTVGATLTDPLPPPPPSISSNQPICVGQTLELAATDADDNQGGAYSWNGPNGFTSNFQNPRISNAPAASSGVYTVTYSLVNCPSVDTATINLYPPITLTNLTLSQTIPYGNSIQLNADGALYYMWLPNDGSLNNPNINNPIATPHVSTVYIVYGTNLAGCQDSASITITIDSTSTEFIPSAFTPNGDGLNDVFRIVGVKYQKLVEFNVYNRWGQMVYHNTYDINQGWDGTFNGVPQDIGVYNYTITVISGEGVTKYYKGDVTLIR